MTNTVINQYCHTLSLSLLFPRSLQSIAVSIVIAIAISSTNHTGRDRNRNISNAFLIDGEEGTARRESRGFH